MGYAVSQVVGLCVVRDAVAQRVLALKLYAQDAEARDLQQGLGQKQIMCFARADCEK